MSQPSEKQTQTSPTYGTPTLNDWKLYLRNLQQLPTQQTMAARDSSSSESSFELEESFKALLQRKRQEMQEKACEEHFLAAEGGSRDAARSAPVPQSGNDSTFLERDSISNISDTSFEEMEKICAVLDKVNGFDTSVKEERHKPATATMPGSVTLLSDVTQLEEIDEPSGLWENTILPGGGGGGAVELSPVKRMHLLRPSTILEETTTSSAEASKNSSLDTFISAKQVVEDSDNRNSAISGSEVYRTAQDTFGTDSYARSSILEMDSGVTSDITAVDNRTRHEREEEESGYSKDSTREAGESLLDDMEQHQQQQQHVIILDSSTSDCEEERVDAHGPAGYETLDNADPLESMVSERDESLLEREGSPSYYDEHGETTENYPDEMSMMDEMPDRFNDTLEETDFMLKQGMKLMALKKQQQEEEERRREESQHSYLYREQLESSSQLGKSRTNSDSEDGARPMLHTPKDKYAAKGATTPSGTSHMSYLTPTGGFGAKMAHGSHSGAKQTLFSSVGKTAAPKHPTPSGAVTSSGSFKKPVSRLPQLRVPAGRKFDHIVSPIGAYIKQTPQSMLQTKINRHNNMNLIDVLHSENRDSAISTGSNSGSSSKENHGVNLKGYTSTLPGKGVISSNRAHVLDERNVVRIPGGEKMQKLINNSPTMVIRHEGRIKYAERAADGQQRTLAHNISALTDDSLVDLSVLSNDVSVRVLKDAKRYH